MLWLLSGLPGFTCWIFLLWYSVLLTVESLSLLYLLFISWFICTRKWCVDTSGVIHANQTSNDYVSWSIRIWTKGGVGAPWNRFKPSSKIILLTVPRRYFSCGSFVWFMVCVLIHILTKGAVGVLLNRFKPSSKIFQGVASFVDYLCYFCLVFVMLSCTSSYWCLAVTCWEKAELLALFVMSNCEGVTFPLVSWVRCGA